MRIITFLAVIAIVFMVLNACQKEKSERESPEYNASIKDSIPKFISAEALADSLKSVTIGINEVDDIATNMNRLKSGSIYTDWSGKISFQVFETTSTMNQHNEGLIAYVNPDYVCVGGGGYTMYSDEHGAFFTESRPLEDLSGWVCSSKDHVLPDPHILVTQAIGIKIEGVSRDVLKQYIRLTTKTSSSSNRPYALALGSVGYLTIGGGAKITYNGGGILLEISDSQWDNVDGYSWGGYGKDHRVSDTGTVTSYLIQIKNDSIPGFGRIEMGSQNVNGNYVSYGLSTAQVNVTPNLWGITCIGANGYGSGAGRLIKGLEIYSPTSIQASSIDNYYKVSGSVHARAHYIRKKQ